ncbi:short/branched chain specific acyl-CoA dehydrogenase, mitochondrial-like [Lingula anatina]|uniref:Short/branched chain specific acyl-CoA dehydrogenase, mitochondrial-like n=1 Tax=Lingula anatina TaxID=7574 RepID=A0A1S3IX17_LINAN|nr:short/branched chain specific acyl-CoA dehydrogenase, mitochondrial-like [Lingula anatina]|eukprot:XP_013402089.1 short/branched chain specific acyl-CoA dehydrogenase, mitochondrial-like [Lingula anatina]
MFTSLLRRVLQPKKIIQTSRRNLFASQQLFSPTKSDNLPEHSDEVLHAPLYMFTEEETMMKETVAKLAKDKIEPLVREMDEKSQMDPSVIKALFENGVRRSYYAN